MTIAEKAEDDESAHMVLFGNLVINLVDGLTMGTAFGEGLIRGLSVSAAIIVTQFPQEIGR
jgi:zinc transporter ZupT